MDKSMENMMDAATKALAKPPKKKAAKKMIHMSIEPSDNKGFHVVHTEHQDGMPVGRPKHHVFAAAADLHKHVIKHYPVKEAKESDAEKAEKIAEMEEMENKIHGEKTQLNPNADSEGGGGM